MPHLAKKMKHFKQLVGTRVHFVWYGITEIICSSNSWVIRKTDHNKEPVGSFRGDSREKIMTPQSVGNSSCGEEVIGINLCYKLAFGTVLNGVEKSLRQSKLTKSTENINQTPNINVKNHCTFDLPY